MDLSKIERGSEDWKRIRRLATQAVPGKHSALYYLNEHILQKGPLIPMTPKAHLGMCMFAEGATGIPEIDSARIKLILVARGIGKTSLVTKALPILKLLQDKEFACAIANETNKNAESFLGDIKAEFESNEFIRLFWPEVIPDFGATMWRSDSIIVNRAKQNPTNPSVLAAGVDKTVTGVHMGLWIIDDMLSQNAAENAYRGSFTEIESTNRWFKRLQPLLKSPKRDPIIFIGTRWWEGDSYEEVEEFWGHDEPKQEFLWRLKLPAYRHEFEGKTYEYKPETQNISVYRKGEIAVFRMPARDDAGRPVFPERYDEEELAAMEMEDPVFFAGQYLLEPTAGAASEFDPAWLKNYEWDGNHIRYRDQAGELRYVPPSALTYIIAVDPAFSKKMSAARTAIPVVGTDGSNLFLMEDFAERGMSEDDIAHQVLDFYRRYGNVQKIIVETIVAQVAVANAIRRIFREAGYPEPPIEEIPHHGDQRKNMRIYGLQHYFKRGIFFVNRNHSRFMQEYRSFPRGKLRDFMDALAFQKDEWERIFRIQGGGIFNQQDRLRREQTLMQQVRNQMKARRYN